MNVHWLIKFLLSTNQAYNSYPNDNYNPNDKIQTTTKTSVGLIKLTTLTLAERILESKYLDELSLTNQTLVID